MLSPSLKRLVCSVLSPLSLAGLLAVAAPAEAASVIDSGVFAQLERSPGAPVWIQLKERADLSGAETRATRAERARFVFDTLSRTADRSQAGLRGELTRRGVRFKSYWLDNSILVWADRPVLEALALRPEVKAIVPNPTFRMLQAPVAKSAASSVAAGVEWNVQKIQAPAVWAAGYRGEGIVVAGNDTGVEHSHAAISKQYRGYTTAGASHDYNWFDAIGGRAIPYDDNSHGTFTVGQMVGDDGRGNQIGVAPGAQWMACKNMNAAGFGSPASYKSCFQFFIAPTDVAGNNPRPEMAPDVVNNSWSCPKEEGCTAETLHEDVNTVQAAGVMLVFSAGNSGPGCGTVQDPPATYPEVFSVGATDSSDAIAGFSSRGPSSYDRGLKPNVSAPGVNVRSCAPGGGYTSMSGTSMAAPEVAGAIALLWSADPAKKGDMDAVATLLESTATRKLAPKCGGDSASRTNNTFGYGIINAKAALDKLKAGAR